MSGKMEKRFPPYQGREPYLYFCFSAADRKRVRPLLERMYARGTRVWYSIGKPRDLAERREREARMTGAALVVLYLTAAARGDVDFKNAALYCQDRGLRLLCIDADGGDSALSFGFTAKARHLDGLAYHSAVSLEAALVRCEGFSQELIGSDQVKPPPPFLRAALVLAAVSVLSLALVLLGGRAFGWFEPSVNKDDTVFFADASLRAAVRAAVGGGAITDENISAVETLRFKTLPENGEELEKLAALTRVEIPQSAAADALWLLDEGYTVVLYGGAGA